MAGDFNELPEFGSLAPLLRAAGLRNSFEKLPNDVDRWTHRDDAVPSKNDQIDYLLVSEGSGHGCGRWELSARGIWASAKKTRAKYPPLATVTGDSNSASDPRCGLGGFRSVIFPRSCFLLKSLKSLGQE